MRECDTRVYEGACANRDAKVPGWLFKGSLGFMWACVIAAFVLHWAFGLMILVLVAIITTRALETRLERK